MSFKCLLFSQKSPAITVSHNVKYASDISFTIFTAVLLDGLKQTYQIFITAIFQDVSEDLILSYDLILYFHRFKSFSLLFLWDLTILTSFVRNLLIS